ncbi:MAG: sodium transporter [Gemmatales bacterium]|nr:MAG: sodium transporter [Gemmatales bacterium]
MFDNYAEYEYLLAQIQLVLFMLGMGATLVAEDFVRIAKAPRALLVGAWAQFFLTPFVAVLVNTLWRFEQLPGIAVGLILMATLPGGSLSKLFTYLGKGNIALSITLTGCGTLAALATVPLFLKFLAAQYVPDEFALPVGLILRDLILFLITPLVLGMMIGRFQPRIRKPFSRWCVRIGFVFVILMVVGSLKSGRIRPGEYGFHIPIAIIFFCVLSMQVSMLPFRLLRWPKPDCLAVGIEVTMRNINLALLLKASLFPARQGSSAIADGVLFVILFYAPVALGAGLPLALNFRRMIKQEEAERLAKSK